MTTAAIARVLCCCLALLGLCSAAAHAVPADPFQRYIIFYNDLPITVYPVITAVESENSVGLRHTRCQPSARR